MAKKETVGITAKKTGDFSDWYTQVLQKAELIEYTDVSGCYVFRPYSYKIWEFIQDYLDSRFKESGVQNAYFPLLIPESYFTKEAEHVEGFVPEVAWVTHSGHTKLNERLAIRPTSETIMYPAYKKWIRSHRDLPLRINQWNNVVRWEFKNPVPFLRSREFLWQEGHTVFATKQEAIKEALEILDIYADAYEKMYAIPVMKGTKSEKEKFAGADITYSIETVLPNGKAIQCATSHNLGQNFSKAFGLTFKDKDEKEKYPWQNSWGFSTRSIGIAIMFHGDDKGLVLPPKVAPIKAVIIPILFEDSKKAVLKEAKKIKDSLDLEIELDDREDYTPGWKFNEWEMKGVPIRIEFGPKDLKKKQVIVVRRDNGKKHPMKISALKKEIPKILEDMQKSLLTKARKRLKDMIVEVKSFKDLQKAIKDKKIAKTNWCGDGDCEDWIKDKTGGAKSLNSPFKSKASGKCVQCGKKATTVMFFGKSY